ncbi:MAG TPA: dihydroorotate dehydrogenase electron transfer subunit [bacterium]|nr:dihydroorotate dehydrogenase electron transfer subunit [bacterium]
MKRLTHDSQVVFNRKIGRGIFHMRLAVKAGIRVKPGQFINLLVSDSYDPLLRRPFSVFDASEKSIDIVYSAIGRATFLMSRKIKGESLNFTGPRGNSYIDFITPGMKKTLFIVVGGGTGAASANYLAKWLRRAGMRLKLIQGAASKGLLIKAGEFCKKGVLFSTDDGSAGIKGFATDIVKKAASVDSVVFACGPKPMLGALKKAVPKGTRVFVSLEEYMGCGIGACVSCVTPVKVKNAGTKRVKNSFEYKRVCVDGTVFELDELVL